MLSTWVKEVEAPGRSRGQMVWKVFSAFEKLGPPMTSHAEPSQFRGGVLHLIVDDSTWLTELGFLKTEILGRINGSLGREVVKELRMRHGVLRKRPDPRAQTKRPKPVLAETEDREVQSWAETIEDPELRERFIAAARWSLSNRKREP